LAPILSLPEILLKLPIALGHLLLAKLVTILFLLQIVTVRIPHCFSHPAIVFSSSVVQPKRRTDAVSRVGGTAT
jgi:hypothetical protein